MKKIDAVSSTSGIVSAILLLLFVGWKGSARLALSSSIGAWLLVTAGFADVPPGRFYSRAVDWLLHRGITAGTAPGRFSPEDVVTRAQMAAFLWRLAGSPV